MDVLRLLKKYEQQLSLPDRMLKTDQKDDYIQVYLDEQMTLLELHNEGLVTLTTTSPKAHLNINEDSQRLDCCCSSHALRASVP